MVTGNAMEVLFNRFGSRKFTIQDLTDSEIHRITKSPGLRRSAHTAKKSAWQAALRQR